MDLDEQSSEPSPISTPPQQAHVIGGLLGAAQQMSRDGAIVTITNPESIKENTPIEDLGLGSLEAVDLIGRLQSSLGEGIPTECMEEAGYLAQDAQANGWSIKRLGEEVWKEINRRMSQGNQ